MEKLKDGTESRGRKCDECFSLKSKDENAETLKNDMENTENKVSTFFTSNKENILEEVSARTPLQEVKTNNISQSDPAQSQHEKVLRISNLTPIPTKAASESSTHETPITPSPLQTAQGKVTVSPNKEKKSQVKKGKRKVTSVNRNSLPASILVGTASLAIVILSFFLHSYHGEGVKPFLHDAVSWKSGNIYTDINKSKSLKIPSIVELEEEGDDASPQSIIQVSPQNQQLSKLSVKNLIAGLLKRINAILSLPTKIIGSIVVGRSK